MTPKKSFFAENPERMMIVAFPVITLALFFGAALLAWLIQFLLTSNVLDQGAAFLGQLGHH